MLSRTAVDCFSINPLLETTTERKQRVAASVVGSTAFSTLLILAIFVADVSWARTNVSVFYVVALLLLAKGGNLRYVWYLATLAAGLTFTAYLIKRSLDPLSVQYPFLNFSLFNRALAAGSMLATSWMMRMWDSWRKEVLESELPEDFRAQEREISETVAVMFCLPTLLLIAVIDLCAPANYNMAILYLIPLFICVWTRSRRLLWVMLGTLLMLAAAAHYFGPPPTDAMSVPTIGRNRLVAAAGLTVVTILLNSWITPANQRETEF